MVCACSIATARQLPIGGEALTKHKLAQLTRRLVRGETLNCDSCAYQGEQDRHTGARRCTNQQSYMCSYWTSRVTTCEHHVMSLDAQEVDDDA